MGSTFRIRAKLLARVVAPILFATALSACSTVPDWVDPTTWIGGDQVSGDQSSDAGAATDQTAAAGQQAASSQSPATDQTPDIAAIPPKPAPPTSAEEQKQVTDSLAADRAEAHYSADALRGGTETAAAPPPAAAPQASGSSTALATPEAGGTASASGPGDQTAEVQASGSPADDQAAPHRSAAPAAGGGEEQTTPGTQTASTAGPANTPAAETAASSAPAPNEVASTGTESTSAPAAAPMASETGVPSAQASPDMQATFAPSKAPALDPSVSQFVPQQILLHYHETAAGAAVPAGDSSASARHHRRKKIKTSQAVVRLHYVSLENPGHKRLRLHYASTTNIERFGMIPASYSPSPSGLYLSRAAPKQSSSFALDPSFFAPADRAAAAVVNFPRETTILDGKARNRIHVAARNFAALGGSGFVRVVGHAWGTADNVPRAVRLRNNFERSEAQATAVARELIRDGVPPQKVLVEAVGDNPVGDHAPARASRSAEIFLQS